MDRQTLSRPVRLLSLAMLFVLLVPFLLSPVNANSADPDLRADGSLGVSSYIVQGTDVQQVASLVEKYGGRVTSELGLIHGVGAELPAGAAARLESEPAVTAVTTNAMVEVADKDKNKDKDKDRDKDKDKDKNKDKDKDRDKGQDKDRDKGKNEDRVRVPETDYPDVVGADVVWSQGVTGSGVTVAVLDSGLELIPGVFEEAKNRSHPGNVLGWVDFVDQKRQPQDPNGHGTHIAGIIANPQIGKDGEWNGVAPEVNLVAVRVLDKHGAGTYEQVIRGIQWVVEHKEEYNIRVMNLSLVSPVQSPYWADPLNQAIMQAWDSGITVVVAAGNSGPGAMSVGVPGNNPYVITVGAFTDNYTPSDWNDDYIAPFSAAGPTLDGFAKPDLVAPGAHMVSIIRPKSYIVRNHQADKAAPHYFTMAGTSQAAGVVSGMAALVLSAHPELTPNQVKQRLLASAFPWVDTSTTTALYSVWQQGAGRANAPDSVFGDNQGEANIGLDIQADLAGIQHYEGFSYYDETTGLYRLRGDYTSEIERYWAWDGGYDTWSGGYSAWNSGYGIWAGGYGIWAGGYGIWAGGYGIWAGGYGIWAGGYGIWAGGYGIWAGSVPWDGSMYAEPSFVERFLAGESPDVRSTTTSVNDWVEGP